MFLGGGFWLSAMWRGDDASHTKVGESLNEVKDCRGICLQGGCWGFGDDDELFLAARTGMKLK